MIPRSAFRLELVVYLCVCVCMSETFFIVHYDQEVTVIVTCVGGGKMI
jgi:hypothetical protein